MPLAAHTNLGPYEILSLIGEGGMGEVYKARDTRLDRIVALKVSKEEFSERLTREARAIASLNYPHICQIFDVGPDYLVMEYIEGTAFKGPLPVTDALRFASQIADALTAAHTKGITHRDLKPANILLTASGVKLLDFGLAKLTAPENSDATQTVAGAVVGTAAYMSPEQVQGKPADARSDIFSFGLVFYELLTGRRAFAGDTAVEAMAAILHKEPALLDTLPALQNIVARCLRKSPGDRFQSAAELRAALEAAAAKEAAKPAEKSPSIAVLPFANMSGDKENEYFSDGLAEEIINALAQIPSLKVTARTSAFFFKGKEVKIADIARDLGVEHVLEGSVRKSGNRIRVTAQLIKAADGFHLWSQRYDRELTDVFAVQDEISAAIAKTLEVKLGAARARYTPNLPAYEAFLKGRHHSLLTGPDGWAKAEAYFQEAITLDPAYAEPHAALGLLYLFWGLVSTRLPTETAMLARVEARKALEFSPADPAAHSVFGCIAGLVDFNWLEAQEHFRLAMATEPVPAEVRADYAFYYLTPVGRLHEAIQELEKFLDQDPLNLTWRSILALTLMMAEMYDRAEAEARKVLDLDNNMWDAHAVLAMISDARGDVLGTLGQAEKTLELASWNPGVVGYMAGILTRTGAMARAQELLAQLREGPLKAVAPYGMVMYHLACSEVDQAADWFQIGLEQRQTSLAHACRFPLMKPLRLSERWPALARMMNLPGTP